MPDPVATHTYMTTYMPLAKHVQEWPAGLKEMKKYNIEPYLLEHQAFSNDLHKYKQMLVEAKHNPAVKKQLEPQKNHCKSTGMTFQQNIPKLKTNLQKLAAALAEHTRDGITPEQKTALIGLMQFLKTMQQDMNHDWKKFGVVEGMIKKVEGEVPLQ
jgi:hypothetical protein